MSQKRKIQNAFLINEGCGLLSLDIKDNIDELNQ